MKPDFRVLAPISIYSFKSELKHTENNINPRKTSAQEQEKQQQQDLLNLWENTVKQTYNKGKLVKEKSEN